jgi:hypothetical protein
MEKEFARNCPKCSKILRYKNKKNLDKANKLNRRCRSCAWKNNSKKPEMIQMYKKRSEKYKGSGNPFYGHTHTEESIKKMGENKNYDIYKTKDFRVKISKLTSGKNNPMYGKNCYDVWVEKYGQFEADRRQKELNSVRSKNVSGKKNPMYGRLPPKGSGAGWSGWYKGWFFRSLRELSYMINVIEKKQLKWKSAEKNINIKYLDYLGNNRTYRPDFLINDKILVEVKPKKLMETPNNRLKKIAAIKFCEDNNLEYKMVDVKIIAKENLIKMHNDNLIRFIDKWESVFQNKYLKRDK